MKIINKQDHYFLLWLESTKLLLANICKRSSSTHSEERLRKREGG
jgi:hypothetical protein